MICVPIIFTQICARETQKDVSLPEKKSNDNAGLNKGGEASHNDGV